MSDPGERSSGPPSVRVADLGAGLAPALAALAFAAGLGTFDAPIHGWRVVLGHLVLAALALAGRPAGLDPLALGRRGRWLLAALLGWTAFAAWRSPVPRAGLEALLLVPLLLACVPAVARCWATPARRRIGGMALAAVLLAVAAWALAAATVDSFGPGAAGSGAGLPTVGSRLARAAMPLGHHNLLALWLVTLLPLATAGALDRPSPRPSPGGGGRLHPTPSPSAGDVTFLSPGSGGEGQGEGARARADAGRWLRRVAAALAVVALVVTRSLGGLLALAAVLFAVVVGPGARRRRLLAGSALVLMAVLALPRLGAMVAGNDPSAAARRGYLEAAARGVTERPLEGWGPGAAAWTLAEHLRPVPGVNPPGQVVADPHSLPALAAYEVGSVGLVLVVAIAWAFLRRRAAAPPRDARAAGLALLAFAVAASFTRPAAATAVWVLAAVAAGARLAAPDPARPAVSRLAARWQRRLATVLVLACAVGLAWLDAARIVYGRAVAADDPATARAWLARAHRLDPAHPLYRARLAALDGDGVAAADAAADARGVAALWLAAAQQGGAGQQIALASACRLDPLSPLARLGLALAEPSPERAASLAAGALAAEPRLLAAVEWQTRPQLRSAAVAAAAELEGLDAGWRRALTVRAAESLPGDGPTAALAQWADRDPATALSLHVFRRPPWPWRLAAAVVDADGAARVDLPPASTLAGTAPGVLRGCL